MTGELPITMRPVTTSDSPSSCAPGSPQSHRLSRSAGGAAQISEFAVTLYFLFAFIVIPLINLCVVPIRWNLAKSMVSQRVHQLAQSEKLSQALRSDQASDQWQNAGPTGTSADQQPSPAEELQAHLKDIGGIAVKSSQLCLSIESAKRPVEIKAITKVGEIPKDWLPDGPLGPYIYHLDYQVDVDISPLFVLPIPGIKVPGLSVPFAMQLHDASVWENTGRDPDSGAFYLNE